jgi:hypothetical protein
MEKRPNLAGKTVHIKSHINHFQYPDFGGSEFYVEDYWDVLTGKSWTLSKGNPACLVYALRGFGSDSFLPMDDNVVYGKRKDGMGSLVHISELDIQEEGECYT